MNKVKKVSRQELKRLVEKSIIRDEEIKRIGWSATSSIKEVLISLESSLNGLDAVQIRRSRMIYGKNQTTDDKKKNIVQLLLDSLHQPDCYVVRKNENMIHIPNKELVVGDIVHLEEGDMVPADLRIIESKSLVVDQTALSDNQKFVKKNAGVCLCELDRVTDYCNIVLMGTKIISGSGEAVVLSVGSRTIMGTMS